MHLPLNQNDFDSLFDLLHCMLHLAFNGDHSVDLNHNWANNLHITNANTTLNEEAWEFLAEMEIITSCWLSSAVNT